MHWEAMLARLNGLLLLDIEVTSRFGRDQLVSGPHYWSFLDERLVGSGILVLVDGSVASSWASWSVAIDSSCGGLGSHRDHISSYHINT